MGVQHILATWNRATAHDLDYGLNAYVRYHENIKAIGERRGFCADTSCAVFSALSPNNDEQGNFTDMASLMDSVMRGDDPYKVAVKTYRTNRAKAIRILRGEKPLDVLGGLKTRAFYNCLANPQDSKAVVVDGHIFSVWHGRRYRMDDAKMAPWLYETIAEDFRYLSSILHYLPSQIQATCWFTWKRIHDIRYTIYPHYTQLDLFEGLPSSTVRQLGTKQTEAVPDEPEGGLSESVSTSRVIRDCSGETDTTRVCNSPSGFQQAELVPVQLDRAT